MDEQTGHKTFKYQLKPTPEQEQPLDRTLMLSRHVYNAAVGERREAWRMRGVSVSYYQQKAELPGIKKAMPEYAEVNPRRPRAVPPRVCSNYWLGSSVRPGRHRAMQKHSLFPVWLQRVPLREEQLHDDAKRHNRQIDERP